MAVKQASAKLTSVGVNTSATYTNPLASNTAAGSTLLLSLVHYSGSNNAITTVTIGGQSATRDIQRSNGSNGRVENWRVNAATGGNRGTVVISGFGTDNYVSAQLLELDAFDATPVDVSANNQTSTSTPTIATATTTQADEFVIAVTMAKDGRANNAFTVPSGYTAGFTEQDSNGHQGGMSAYKYVTSTGVQTAVFGCGGAYTNDNIIITYKWTPVASGAIVGSATLAITPSGSISSPGALTGAAALSIAPTGTLTGSGYAVGVVQQSTTALHQNGSATVYTQTDAFDATPTPHNSATMLMSCHDNGVGSRPSSVTIGGVAAVNVLAAEHDTTSTRESSWYVQDLGASPNKDVVITYATATNRYQTFGVLECTPLTASPVDQARGMYWYDGSGWPQVISLPGPTTQASELLMVMTICGTGQSNINITSPAASGYTDLFTEIDSNTYQGGQASYKVLTATETSTATWDDTAATSDHWSTVMVSFKFAAPPEEGAMVGTTTVALASSGVLLGAAPATGAAALAVTSSATLTGSAPIVGATALALVPAASLIGAAPLVGTTTVALSPTATLAGSILAVGSTALTFASVGTLSGAAPLVGTTDLGLAIAGTLDAPPSALEGSAALALDAAGALQGTGALVGSTSISLTATGSAGTGAPIAGTSALALAVVGTLTAEGALQGTSSVSLAPSGALTGAASIQGDSTLSLATTGTMLGLSPVTGSTALALVPVGQITGAGALQGAAALVLAGSAQITGNGVVPISGVAALSLIATGSLNSDGALTGTATVGLSTFATLGGTATAVGTATMAFDASATGNLIGNMDGAAFIAVAMTAELLGRAALQGTATLRLTTRATPEGYSPVVDGTIVWADDQPGLVVMTADEIPVIVLTDELAVVPSTDLVLDPIVWEDAPT